MKKFGLLIMIALLVSIGGVYATWYYTQSDDVADITNGRALNMSGAKFEGTYGEYTVDTSKLVMTVDPKAGTAHVTALYITGEIVVTFTPSTYAPDDVKSNGVVTTCTFGVSNADWKYDGTNIVSVDSTPINVVWTRAENGTFTYTISAETLADIITLSEITLDTKADYDAYDNLLTLGQITISISDGKASSTGA